MRENAKISGDELVLADDDDSHLLTKRLHPRGRSADLVIDRLNANIRIADSRLRPLLIR
jgi:hypothetical protein